MGAIEMLARQAAQRDASLREVVQRLEKDHRFVAAWLVGSLGNGSADELSDIDMVVVVDDRYAEAVLTHSTEEVATFGETTWLKDVPGNAPTGGAYVSAGFLSVPLPVAVDWYWQPLSQAVLPSDARFLFHKAPIPPSDPPASFAELMSRRAHVRSPSPSDQDRVAFFWAMVPVAAKYGARGWDEEAKRIVRGLQEQIDTIGAGGASKRTSPEATSLLKSLRLLIDRMDRLTPTLGARGIRPADTLYARAFMRLAESLKEEGWRGRIR